MSAFSEKNASEVQSCWKTAGSGITHVIGFMLGNYYLQCDLSLNYHFLQYSSGVKQEHLIDCFTAM